MKAIYTRIYPRLPIYKLYTPNQRILTYFSLKPIPLNIYLTFKETVGVIWIYLFKETVGVIWIYLFKELYAQYTRVPFIALSRQQWGRYSCFPI